MKVALFSKSEKSEKSESSEKSKKSSLFSNLKVSHKIWALAGILIAANVAVVATILVQMNTIKTEIEEIATEHMPLTELTTKITVHQRSRQSSSSGVCAWPNI